MAICGRHQDRLDEAVASLEGKAIGLVADVSDADQAAAFVRDARDQLGGLDILVANAGGPTPGAYGAVGLDEFRAAVDLNLLSTIALCDEAIPTMRAQGWGRVVASRASPSASRSPT